MEDDEQTDASFFCSGRGETLERDGCPKGRAMIPKRASNSDSGLPFDVGISDLDDMVSNWLRLTYERKRESRILKLVWWWWCDGGSDCIGECSAAFIL